MTEAAASPPTSGTHRWVSLMVRDVSVAQRFYGELFGWEFDAGPAQLGPYVRALRDGHPVAGLGELASGVRSTAVSWLPYIATEDVDATAGTIRECGGTVAVGPIEVDQVGRLAIASDVNGAVFGLWQGGPRRSRPFYGPAGTPEWNELITADTSVVSKFYSNVLGYEAVPEPALPEEMDYLTLRLNGRPVASIRGVGARALPPDRGPHWQTYFSVPDVDQALRDVERLGGRALSAPEVSPFGRWAKAADPEGGIFAVVRPPGR
ncbi:VOC family protein [Streptomyces sp. 3MP-14]|uniref:VOC family protein n=2 Tax=Streptomyces TaxID=1883 RepID=A0A5N6AJ60_9ACTN|nr:MULTISPECIES: VOC family protein [Streptomyces]KAB8167910.1 VOC family protein [Streptomyces mimosae]KAB8177442.1 VOC family protein [Streptomyces sp. 3MP-14]